MKRTDTKNKSKLIVILSALTAGLAAVLLILFFFGKREAYISFSSCLITEGASGTYDISINGSCSRKTADRKLYLMELKPWEDDISPEAIPALEFDLREGAFSLSIPLNEASENTRLFSSFIAAEKTGRRYTPVSERIYVNNPELIAEFNEPAPVPESKKGLLVDLDSLDDARELGVKHAIVNIEFTQFFGMGDEYEYEGETYRFNTDFIKQYDDAIKNFTENGISVTAVLLNRWCDEWPELRLPDTKPGKAAHYYLLSTATEKGMWETAAAAAFLAERYSGKHPEYGRVTNWVVGNEINNPENWNYAGDISFDEYMHEYERTFRVVYTAIRGVSADTGIFYSVDRDWNYADTADSGEKKEKRKYPGKYPAKDVVFRFNTDIKSQGNIDWQLALHPYNDPMYEPEFWEGANITRATESPDTEIVNFRNLHVITDILKNEEFLNRHGKVRHVILSEQGFSAVSKTRGNVEDLQAEAFKRAYRIAEDDPCVDAFILSRQTDAPPEVHESLAFGLWSCDENGRRKDKRKLWYVFRDIDRKDQ